MDGKLYHGVSFYPELWDRQSLIYDIKEMKKLGINLVRMGEFAWSTLEPREDYFDFELFKEITMLLAVNGIDIVFCTPTPTPPIWLTHNHPERCHKDRNGVMGHGSRQHICTNNPYFRERAARITEKLAETFGKYENVVMWQLDNELKAHVSYCLCETCKERWHAWLEKRYGTIEVLNQKWGTNIFSETYQAFEQVPQPVKTPFLHNASLQTMYRVFSMDMIAEFAWEQADMIRKYTDQYITTNGSINFDYNFGQMFSKLDVAAFDTYASSRHHYIYVMNHDFWRAMKQGRKHWLLETSCSYGGSIRGNPSPHPSGYLVAEAVSGFALNSQSFCYWPWKQQRTGCEINHSAVLSSWGKPSIGYSEVEKVRDAIEKIEPIILKTELKKPEIALHYSDMARAFYETEKLPSESYTGMIRNLHRMIYELGLPRDVVTEYAEVDGYKLVWTAFMPCVEDKLIEKMKQFVENGGTWIAGPMIGYRTQEHTVSTDCALGRLEKEFGFSVKLLYPMTGAGISGEAFDKQSGLEMLGCILEENNDEKIIGVIKGGCTPDQPFAAEKRVGKGRLVILGAYPSSGVGNEGSEMLKTLVKHYTDKLDIKSPLNPTVGTLVAERTGTDGAVYYFVVNTDGLSGKVTLNGGIFSDALTGEAINSEYLEIERYGYRIIMSSGESN